MKIHSAELAISAHRPDQFRRDGRPEVAFVGRSNVGKSSLMNRLLARKALARTSSTPGRTQAVNYFLINDRYYFVDLPGYGFAKASRTSRERWAVLMDAYFRDASARDAARDTPGRDGAGPDAGGAHPAPLLIQLVDAKVGATDLDVQAIDYFDSLDLDLRVVATKIDKVPRSKRVRQLRGIAERLRLVAPPLAVSAASGEGVPIVWKEIQAFLDGGEAATSG
ncbi:MAG: ribosome biogenesis GTP-binding protein YihA/YsxC [Acidobacteriota bacterium]